MPKYFKREEFACKHCGENLITPELLELVDSIREEFGHPLRVSSGYRCETHNKAVGGVTSSKHTLGLAADLVPMSGDLEVLKGIADRLNPSGGVGLNYKSFVHVDTRGSRARW